MEIKRLLKCMLLDYTWGRFIGLFIRLNISKPCERFVWNLIIYEAFLHSEYMLINDHDYLQLLFPWINVVVSYMIHVNVEHLFQHKERELEGQQILRFSIQERHSQSWENLITKKVGNCNNSSNEDTKNNPTS